MPGKILLETTAKTVAELGGDESSGPVQTVRHTKHLFSALTHSDAKLILETAMHKLATAKLKPSRENIDAAVDAFQRVLAHNLLHNPVQAAEAAVSTVTVVAALVGTVIAIAGSETGITLSAITPLLGVAGANAQPILRFVEENGKVFLDIPDGERQEVKGISATDVIAIINKHPLSQKFINAAKQSIGKTPAEKKPSNVQQKDEGRSARFLGFDDD